MDFRKLMEQASFNQTVSERMRERKKQVKEYEKSKEREEELEKKRNAAERLKHLNAEAVKARLVYKGLLSDRAPPPNNSASPDTRGSKTASRGEKTSSSSTTKAGGGGSRNQPQATNGHSSKSLSHKSATPLPKVKTKPPPANFSELMKIAQKNLEKPKQQPQQQTLPAHGERVSKEKARTLAPPLPNGGQRKSKSVSPTPVKKPIASRDGQQRSRTPTGSKQVVKPSSRIGLASSVSSSKTGNNSRGPQKDQRVYSSNGGVNSSKGRGSGRGRGRVAPTLNPAKADSFYGAASSQLARDERPRFQTKRQSFLPHSSMAGQMSDYMLRLEQERKFREEEEEDDYDDEDDFIDDADDCDYSAAIREIFGYDKNRFRDDDGGEVMESSFAQQQFEEKRSAHIGRQEDQEDIRREQLELARKRKKPGAGRGGNQKKLKF